jgi:NAD(P)-dependent dehydrogenase (short-subunit alcohol dehydrogenase family)
MTQSLTAFVTGAGSGIGRAAALTLQADGFSVVLAGRRKAQLEETATLKAANGGRMLVVATDVSDPDSVEAAFLKAKEAFGRIDLLFNNAGIDAPVKPIDELAVEEWKAVIDINLTGAFLCARQAVKVMKTQDPKGGRIINNGSVAAYVPRPNSAPYAASKHAITGLTKSVALDGRPYNIACGQIDIGNAASEMWLSSNQDGARMLQADGSMAVEPIIDVKHIAEAIRYMANLPLEANVQFMTVMATKMPYVGRG